MRRFIAQTFSALSTVFLFGFAFVFFVFVWLFIILPFVRNHNGNGNVYSGCVNVCYNSLSALPFFTTVTTTWTDGHILRFRDKVNYAAQVKYKG